MNYCDLLFLDNLLGWQKGIVFVAVSALICAVLIILVKFLSEDRAKYSLKDEYLTKTEQAYFKIILKAVENRYYVYPQVNLASVINKDTPGYRTELFRNADFGIFDAKFKPILLIEINDNTHLKKDRKQRDKQVNKICKRAGISVVTFWLKDNPTEEKIIKTIQKYI